MSDASGRSGSAIDGHFADVPTSSSASTYLLRGMSLWREQGLFTDLTLRCNDGHDIRVHKIVVCPQSRFFHNACKPDSPFKEARLGIIELTEDSPEIVQCMVQYLYDQEYRAARPPDYEKMTVSEKRWSNLKQHLECYYLADKYDIQQMKDHAASKTKLIIKKERLWTDNVFPKIVKSILENTLESDRDLRASILKTCSTELRTLMGKPGFEQTMNSVDGFWKELAREKAGFPQMSARWVRCPTCKRCLTMLLPLLPSDNTTANCMLCYDNVATYATWFQSILPPPHDIDGPGPEEADNINDGSLGPIERMTKRRRMSPPSYYDDDEW